jgi:Fe-S-cluster containining protein
MRCTGHCCKEFFLPFGPEELEAAYHRWLRSAGQSMGLAMSTDGVVAGAVYGEIHLIYPMVQYLGKFKEPPFRQVNNSGNESRHYYSCKHYDTKTHNCTIYEIRPMMCRDYPYRGSCNYAACTWTERKQAKEKPIRKGLKIRKEDEVEMKVKG